MIYIDFNTKSIEIPKHLFIEGANSEQFTLKLENNLTHQITEYRSLTNVSKSNRMYEFETDFNLVIGEYTYSLIIDDGVVEQGLLVFGDYKKETKAYTAKSNTIQYRK